VLGAPFALFANVMASEAPNPQDTPQVRHNYYLTLKHPEMCAKRLP